MKECNELNDEIGEERQPKKEETNKATEQKPGTYCPYCMSPICPMMATGGLQFAGGGKPVQQGTPGWWQGTQGDYSYMQGTLPNYFSDVWTQSQPNCMQNCMQDMYMQSGVPGQMYGHSISMPNQYMYGLNQIKPNDRDNSSYGSCCNPYGLGRY
ncbi:MAG: hypothetical protein J6Y29_04015 [Clostridiales bacterium]|nr:hypothetical protein [Clostridiales bacterium]